MTERSILFSGPMVRALLDGRKTQTRRVVKPQPWPTARSGHYHPSHPSGSGGMHPASVIFSESERLYPPWAAPKPVICPFGEPGDRLWVRETHVIESNQLTDDHYDPPFSDRRPVQRFGDDGHLWRQPHYRATDPEPELWYDDMDVPGCRWRPSIHMPRWASRILLEVKSVRVERLQDISEDDAWAEGWADDAVWPLDWYRDLWNSLNAARGYGWDVNPWVWVVEFCWIKT